MRPDHILGEHSQYGSSVDGGTDEKRMRLSYAGSCRVCGVQLPARAEAVYERTTKTVRCISHDESPPAEPSIASVFDPALRDAVDPGTAGASARREFERRKAKR